MRESERRTSACRRIAVQVYFGCRAIAQQIHAFSERSRRDDKRIGSYETEISVM